MTSPPPKKSDIQTTLNRLRKNYAQNPLYTWLFSASGISLESLLTVALALIPKSYRQYPGTPAFWSIPICAALTAYGG